MKDSEVALGLNLWMDSYIEHPDQFKAEFEAVMEHMAARSEGREPSYGEVGLEYMRNLLAAQANAAA